MISRNAPLVQLNTNTVYQKVHNMVVLQDNTSPVQAPCPLLDPLEAYRQSATCMKLLPKRFISLHQWLGPLCPKELKAQLVSDLYSSLGTFPSICSRIAYYPHYNQLLFSSRYSKQYNRIIPNLIYYFIYGFGSTYLTSALAKSNSQYCMLFSRNIHWIFC